MSDVNLEKNGGSTYKKVGDYSPKFMSAHFNVVKAVDEPVI